MIFRIVSPIVFVLVLSFSSASSAEEKVLNIYNWADYVAPQTIAQFEEEFGIRVNYDTYDNGLMVDARLLAGNSGYDVVLQGGFDAERLIPIGVYLPLDKSKLPNIRHMDPDLMSKVTIYDPGNRHGVIFMWGSVGIAFNVDKILERMPDAPMTSSAMLFDPAIVSKFADCGVSFLDEAGGMISLALQHLGYSDDTLDRAKLAEAEALLKAVRPYIRYYSNSKLMIDLPAGETCMAVTWSGDFGQAKDRADDDGAGINLTYEVPREGSDLWFDMWWIPSDAPHPNNAYLFLDFMMRPEVIADNSNFTVYANANTASIPFLLPEVYNSEAAYPPQEVLDVLHASAPRTLKDERVRTRIWARVKTGF